MVLTINNALINTNMYTEAFHRVLKYVYLRGRINKRLDKLIYVLLKLSRDKGFEREIEKGKYSERLNIICKRHQSSLKLSLSQVSETDDPLMWNVSSNDSDINYTVVLDNKICPQKCSMLCPECNICIHMFTCNCADALICTTICKHIHLVARYTLANSQINKEKTVPYCNVTESTKLIEKQQSPIDSTLEVSPEFSEEYVDKMSLLETLQDKEQLCDIAEIRSTVQTQLSILSADLCCVHDRETLKHVREFITSANKSRKVIYCR